MVPGQTNPKGDVSWTDLKLQGQESLAARAAKKLKNEESLLVQMRAVRLRMELDRVAEEVVQHLTGLVGANVEITIEIRADLADGASDKTVRDVTENCRTLKFENYGFEEH